MLFDKTKLIIKDINKYFGFLYAIGFEIQHAEYSPQFNGNWVVQLKSSVCFIYITSDRNNISMEISALDNGKHKNRISIEKLIYLLSDGSIVVEPFKGNLAWEKRKQLERLSNLLKIYINQILVHFANRDKR